METLAQLGVVAVGAVAEHRRGRDLPTGGTLDEPHAQLGLGPKDDLLRNLRLAATLGVRAPLLGQVRAQPNGTVPFAPTACTDTPSWQLPILPSVPEYCRLTPGESLPSLGKPVSSSTHASTSISGATRSATARTTSAGSQGLSARNCCRL